MNRRAAAIAFAGLLLVVFVAITWWRIGARLEGEADGFGGEAGETAATTTAGAEIDLYFPGRNGRLYREARELAREPALERRVERLVAEILAGPRSEGLYPALPADVEVTNVHLSPSGVAFVDLASPSPSPPLAGSRHEILTVYSLVNSILINEPEIESVVLLWNGVQRATFAGHLDTSRPLRANTGWIVR